MKQLYYTIFCLLTLPFLASCYDDKGGNDFDSPMQDVTMVIPGTAYSGPLGSTITITPKVETDIPESDLQFIWEANGDLFNEVGRETYSPLLPEEQWQKVLTYTCRLDDNIANLNVSYEVRLHARQISTGRDFYSDNTVTLTIEGITGLLVLHGDDNTSDVGVLTAEEFMPSTSSIPETPGAQPTLYTDGNGGTAIAGRGEAIVQTTSSWMSPQYMDRARIYVKTDEEVAFLNYETLAYDGDWNSLFYLGGRPEQVNDGDPQGYVINGQNLAAFDGDDVFIAQPFGSSWPYLFASYTPESACSDGHAFTFLPFFTDVHYSGIQNMMYANSVDGDDTRKGFVGVSTSTDMSTGGYPGSSRLLDTRSDNVPFNPGDMKADLVQMKMDGRSHMLAVLKDDATHPDYPGQYFAVDLMPNPDTGSDTGESGYKSVPQYVYNISTFPGIADAIAFDFGTASNMSYYATPSAIYQYGFDGSTVYQPNVLNMSDGSALAITGEITMMKFLESPNVTTHNTEPILVVATWDGTNSAIYALHISTGDGKVLRAAKYDAETVDGWAFGRIADVNIKSV